LERSRAPLNLNVNVTHVRADRTAQGCARVYIRR